MQRIEQLLNTIASKSTCALAVVLFAWPIVLMAYIHVELILARTSPVEANNSSATLSPEPDALNKHSLTSEAIERTPVPKLPSVQFIRIALLPETHKILEVGESCEGAEVGAYSSELKTFKIHPSKTKTPEPFATACFRVSNATEVRHLAVQQDTLKNTRKPPKEGGYIVVIPNSEAGYLLFVHADNKEAHVRWARLNKD